MMHQFKASDRSPRSTKQKESTKNWESMREQQMLDSKSPHSNKLKSSIKPKASQNSGNALTSTQKVSSEVKNLKRSTKSSELSQDPPVVQRLKQKMDSYGQGLLKNYEKTLDSGTPKSSLLSKRSEKASSLVLDSYQFMHNSISKNSECSIETKESEPASPDMEKSKRDIERLKANVNALKLRIYGELGMTENPTQSADAKNEPIQNEPTALENSLVKRSANALSSKFASSTNNDVDQQDQESPKIDDSKYSESFDKQLKQVQEPDSGDEIINSEPIPLQTTKANDINSISPQLHPSDSLEKNPNDSLSQVATINSELTINNEFATTETNARSLADAIVTTEDANPVSPSHAKSKTNNTPAKISSSQQLETEIEKRPSNAEECLDLHSKEFQAPSNIQATPNPKEKKEKKKVVISEQEKDSTQNLLKPIQIKPVHQVTSSFGGNLEKYVSMNDEDEVMNSPKFQNDLGSPQFAGEAEFELSPRAKGTSPFQQFNSRYKDRVVLMSYSDEIKEIAESDEARRNNGVTESTETFKEIASSKDSFPMLKSSSLRIENSLASQENTIFDSLTIEKNVLAQSKRDTADSTPTPNTFQNPKISSFQGDTQKNPLDVLVNNFNQSSMQFQFNPTAFNMGQFGSGFISPTPNLMENALPSSNHMMLMMMNYYELHLNNMKAVILKQNDTITNQNNQIRLLNKIIEEYQAKVDSLGHKLQEQQARHKAQQLELETKYENSINELSQFKKSVEIIFKKDLEQMPSFKELTNSNRQSEMSLCEDGEIEYIKKDLEEHKQMMKGYHESRFELENQLIHLEQAYKDEMSKGDKILANKVHYQDRLETYKKQIIEDLRKETGDNFAKNYMETIQAISSQNDDWRKELHEKKKQCEPEERNSINKVKTQKEKSFEGQCSIDDEASLQSKFNKEKNQRSDMKLLLSWDTNPEEKPTATTARTFDKVKEMPLRSSTPITERVSSISHRASTPDQYLKKAQTSERVSKERFLQLEDTDCDSLLKKSKSPVSASNKAVTAKQRVSSSPRKQNEEDIAQQAAELENKLNQLKSQRLFVASELKKLPADTRVAIEKRRRISFERELEAIDLAIEDVKFHMRKLESLRTSNFLFI